MDLAHGKPVGIGMGLDVRHFDDDGAGIVRQRPHRFHLEARVGQPLGQLVGPERSDGARDLHQLHQPIESQLHDRFVKPGTRSLRRGTAPV